MKMIEEIEVMQIKLDKNNTRRYIICERICSVVKDRYTGIEPVPSIVESG